MRRFVTLAASAALFSGLAFAETWTGRLVDANCSNQDKTARECDAGSATTSFLLIVNGKAYQLDNEGNQKVMAALKDRTGRPADPNAQLPPAVNAKISGDKEGDMIKVTAVELQ